MFKTLKCLVAAVVFCATSFWCCNICRAETLREAIDFIIQSNPEIKSQAYNRLARDQEVKQAKAGYLPSLDIRHAVGVSDQKYPFHDRAWPSEVVISLRQNLFRGLVDFNEIERQKDRVDSSAYRLQTTAENITLNGSKVYLNVLRQMELDDLAKENLVNHQRIYDQIKLRSESGVGRKVDLDQVMGRLALAQSNTVVTQANLIDAKTDYQTVIGRLPENLAIPEPVDSLIPATMEEAQQAALNDYPLLKSANSDLEARKKQYKVAKGLNSPSFDLAVDQKWQDDMDGFAGSKEEFIASAVVSFNIFNGGWNQARITETRHLIKEAEEIANATERQVIESSRLSWMAYQAARDKITHLEQYVLATQSTREAFLSQWNIGQRTMFDVLDIEAELINAKVDLANAKYDKIYAQYRVLSGMGKLVHTIGLEWPEESLASR